MTMKSGDAIVFVEWPGRYRYVHYYTNSWPEAQKLARDLMRSYANPNPSRTPVISVLQVVSQYNSRHAPANGRAAVYTPAKRRATR